MKYYDISDGKNMMLKTRIALIMFGAFLALGTLEFIFILITLVTGMGTSRYLGAFETKTLLTVAPIVGASIGYLIGKRKISLNSSNKNNQLIK
jgi:hypothetical protein